MSDNDLHKILLGAAKDDDLNTVITLLEYGVDVNATNSIGQTGLHVAAIWGSNDVLAELLLRGADVNAKNAHGATPLHFAADKSRVESVEILVEAGADVEVRSGNGKTPFEMASDETVKSILGGPPNLDVHNAILCRDAEAIAYLFEPKEKEGNDGGGDDDLDHDGKKAADSPTFERFNEDGLNALHLAVSQLADDDDDDDGHAGIYASTRALNALLDGAAATRPQALAQTLISRALKTGLTPLLMAAKNGDPEVVKALLEAEKKVTTNGESVNLKSIIKGGFHNGQWGRKNSETGEIEDLDNGGITALHAVFEKLEALTENLEYAVDNEAKVKKLNSSISRCVEVVDVLIAHGADVNVKDQDERVALHQAVSIGRIDLVETLLKAGANPNVGGKAVGTGNGVLHHAVKETKGGGGDDSERTLSVLSLVARKVDDVDAKGAQGWTALGLAVRSGKTDAARVLLGLGADPNATMGNGKTPADIARVNNRTAILELIELSSTKAGAA